MATSKTNIYSDGVCVYISVRVSNPLAGKIALLIADIFILSVLYLAISLWIPGLLIVSLFSFGLLIKYTLWNFYGRENLTINTKSFSYQHEYGFVKTAYKTRSITENKLAIGVADTSEDAGERQVRMKFYSYHEFDNIPFEIYSMSFYVSEQEVLDLDLLVERLYLDDLSTNYEFPVINLN